MGIDPPSQPTDSASESLYLSAESYADMASQEKHAEGEARKPTSSTRSRFFRQLFVIYVGIVLGVPSFALVSFVLGLRGFGDYGPPIGVVLSYLQNAFVVSVAVATLLIALLAFLHQIPRFRRYIDHLL